MTLVKTGAGITDIRGGIAGNVFTRDKSGLHCSSKGRRVRGGSELQIKRRKAYRECVNFWKSSISDHNKALWQLSADHHPAKNVIGETIILTAFAQFIKFNIYRAYNDLELWTAPPEP